MEQYFSSREPFKAGDINTESEKIEDKIFANERVDASWDKKHLRIFNSTFAKMGFRDSKFSQCDLSFCVFMDCYFKKTYFEQVKFISCIFINCNFDLATFSNCDFRYASFENCFIAYQQMKSNLPRSQENLCANLCRNLSTQCLKLGEVEDYKAYLFEERAAGETHSIHKLFHKSSSYYSKYTLLEGLEGLAAFLRSKISKVLWGYGERMSALLRSLIVIIALYGIVYKFHMNGIMLDGVNQPGWFSAFYLSICSFFSAPNGFVLKTQLLKMLNLSEHIIGVVLMGFFVAALFRQINRR